MRVVRHELYLAFRAAGYSEREALKRAADYADAKPRQTQGAGLRQGKWLVHASFAAVALSFVLATLIY